MRFILITTLLVLAGCGGGSPVGSSNVASAYLFADFKAVSTGAGQVDVFAQLQDNFGASVYLVNDDRLVTTDVAAPKSLLASNNLFGGTSEFASNVVELTPVYVSDIYYHGVLQSDGSKPVYISLFRDSENTFHDSSVTLPAQFELTYPTVGAYMSRGADIQLTWTNGGNATDVLLETSAICPNSARVQFSKSLGTDSGSTMISATDYLPTAGTANCSLTVTINKINSSTVSSGLGGGGIMQGVQRRSVTFYSVQ